MALNPFREALSQAGLRAFEHESSFKPLADAALARFNEFRDDLERQVRRGDLTMKVAKERAQAAALNLKVALKQQSAGYSPVPRIFLDRLVETSNARKRARDHMSTEGLQRETNRLLRLALVEQQLQTRAREFEAKTYVRMMPNGQAVPTLESLLSFDQTATHAGDDAAREWARRQLESIRPRIIDPADHRRIDLACDRAESVNPRLVASYMRALDDSDDTALETFVENALESRDANACVAAFLLARETPGGTNMRWVRNVLNGLNVFPDAALSTLRSIEAEAREADGDAAHTQAEYAIAVAEAQLRFDGIETPTEEEIDQQRRIRSKPVARLGEPIGLSLDRRGTFADEPVDVGAPFPSSDDKFASL
jgi:hypothetical protein